MIYHVSPDRIADVWATIEPGLEKAIAFSHEETSKEVVRELLEGGKALLVMVDCEDAKTNFAIVEPYSTNRGVWLNIIFAYGESKGAALAGLEHITWLAKACGAFGVKMFSSRPGMAKLARKAGMSPRFQEYVQEI